MGDKVCCCPELWYGHHLTIMFQIRVDHLTILNDLARVSSPD
jgi:hypothetical protein